MTYAETFKKTAFKGSEARSFAETHCDGLSEVEASEIEESDTDICRPSSQVQFTSDQADVRPLSRIQ